MQKTDRRNKEEMRKELESSRMKEDRSLEEGKEKRIEERLIRQEQEDRMRMEEQGRQEEQETERHNVGRQEAAMKSRSTVRILLRLKKKQAIPNLATRGCVFSVPNTHQPAISLSAWPLAEAD